MIVVEGPDGGGKTRLAKFLSSRLGWDVAPRVVDKDTNSMIPSLKTWVDQTNALGPHRRIYDRHRLISEPIYGPIFRDGLTDGFDDMRWFVSRWDDFHSTRSVVLFCIPPLEVVLNNVFSTPDNAIIQAGSRTADIYWQYWAQCARMAGWDGPQHTFHCDYTRDTWEEDKEWLVNYIKSYSKGWSMPKT